MKMDPTPYMRGVADARAGKLGPAFPKPDSSWADRLYARGWSDAMDETLKNVPPLPRRTERQDDVKNWNYHHCVCVARHWGRLSPIPERRCSLHG